MESQKKEIAEYLINSVNDMLTHLEKVYAPNDHFLRRLFRGQSDASWDLKPSLYRIKSNLSFEVIEEILMKNFKKMSRGLLNNFPETYNEWLALAQHHGLPTRLIDWTYSPLIALYFAVSDNIDKDGVVYHVVSEDGELSKKQGKSIIGDYKKSTPLYYKPEHISSRVTSQNSCFILLPSFKDSKRLQVSLNEYYSEEKQHPSLVDLRRLIIPKKQKIKIKEQLNNLGINEFSIFPDLDGLARFLKTDYNRS